LEYRMVKKGSFVVRETMDFVANDEVSENKLVPDAAVVLENCETNRRRLYFLEIDMGSERIVSRSAGDTRSTIKYKFGQYDRYLHSRRYAQTYGAYGEFRSFNLLFVTQSGERIDNIRREIQDFPQNHAAYYRFATFDAAMDDFFGPI
jgi:Replication-relaxation